MKKQFFRVKQLADQTLGKAGKTEDLNYPELQQADKQIEFLHESLSSLNKKIPSSPASGDGDRRMKKTLEFQLSQLYKDDKNGEPDRLFAPIFKKFSEIQHDLAKEFAEHEYKVEDLVGNPLHKILELDFPNILKNKKNLSKYILDKDSASSRYQSSQKDTIKEIMEEADQKVEQTRDILALDMFNVLSKENEMASYILQYLKLQRAYYDSAFNYLDSNIPELEKCIGNSNVKKMFGTSLEEHLRVNKRHLAIPLEICITALSERMTEEGLFRVAGSISKIKRLKASMDSGFFRGLIPEYHDVHVLASIIKCYLRELPDPLLTYHLHNEWMQSVKYPETDRNNVIKGLLSRLPQGNRDNLAYLIQFLAKLTQHKENKMNASNMAVVIGPSLLWDQNEQTQVNMGNCATINMLVEIFIKEVHTFFPDDVSKLVKIDHLYCDLEHKNHRYEDIATSNESINNIDSPRPFQRAGKKRAPDIPIPSKTDQDIQPTNNNDKHNMTASYPSGSNTLHRPPKSKPKSTVGVNTEENYLSLSKNKTINTEDHNQTLVKPVNNEIKAIKTLKINLNQPPQKIDDNFISFDENLEPQSEEHKYVSQSNANVQISKAKPVEPTPVQETENIKTTAVFKVGQSKPSQPVAAPRTIANDHEQPLSLEDVMLRRPPLDDVVLRRPDLDRPAKPEVPARPASLAVKRSSTEDPALHRTQCSVYSVANRQQPCLVNIANNSEQFQPGHDTQMSHKERFLHHSDQKAVPMPRMSLIKQANESNSKVGDHGPKLCDLPPKCYDNLSKSNEKLNETNGNLKPSHVRTKSDGNIVCDISPTSMLKTPPSPRSLNKPTQPPPPPPTVGGGKKGDSTDL